jgi:hypothetical protein
MLRPLILALAVALPAAAADPKEVVEKAIKAHGGADALNKHTAQRATVKGTISAQGMDIDVSGSILRAFPDKDKTTVTLSVMGMELPLVAVTNGKSASLSVAGQAQPLDDDRKADARFGAYAANLNRLTPLVKDKAFTLKAGPEAAVNGSPAAGVIVEHADFKPVTLFFDKESGRLVKATRVGKDQDGQESERESFFADYKAVDGVQLPHALTSFVGGKKQSAFTVEKYELLEKVDDGEFAVE